MFDIYARQTLPIPLVHEAYISELLYFAASYEHVLQTSLGNYSSVFLKAMEMFHPILTTRLLVFVT